MSAPQTVRVEHPEAGVALLRLCRPDQLNALNTVMFAEIAAACEALHADKTVRAVVLTGEGRGFCAAFIRLGLSAGDMGCSWYLPRIVGVGQAAEIMFTGKRVTPPRRPRWRGRSPGSRGSAPR
jgi:enoyl-CoA hydratase/carnithine racemase